jgi:hypothetical protein
MAVQSTITDQTAKREKKREKKPAILEVAGNMGSYRNWDRPEIG